MSTSGFMVTFQGTVMGEMAGEVGAELVQRGRLQARFEQPLCLACPSSRALLTSCWIGQPPPASRAPTCTSGGAPTAR
jgi:hypothetical protein